MIHDGEKICRRACPGMSRAGGVLARVRAERGARLGNFGVTEVSDRETWVTVAEWMQTWGPKPGDYSIPMKYGSNNRVFAARIRWGK